jgi:cobalt/nickel transport system permease protein
MPLRLVDPVGPPSSPLRRLPAAVKLPAAVIVLLALVLAPRGCWEMPIVAGLFLLLVAALGRIPPGRLLARLLLMEPFVLGVAALSLLQPGGGRIFIAIVVRSTLCLLAMILLAFTTPFTEVLGLLKRVRVPALLVTVLALTYRYLFVLLDERERLQRARASRTFVRQRARQWTSLASVIGVLFVRSSERGERIYDAMRARGWR